MTAHASSDALPPSQDGSQTGWNKLPKELKLNIFECLTDLDGAFEPYMIHSPLGVGFYHYPMELDYYSKDFDWKIRALSKQDCMIYEQVLKKSIGESGLDLKVEIAGDHGETPLEINDNIHCIPDVRSSTSRPTIWYMRTWCGIVIATAYEALKARIETSTSLFSFDVSRLEPIISQAIDRMRKEMIRGMVPDSDSTGGCDFRGNVQNFFAFLCLKQAVTVEIFLPSFDVVAPVDYINFIHDLRYFADNSLLEVQIEGLCREDDQEEWKSWLQAVGGQIKWELDSRGCP